MSRNEPRTDAGRKWMLGLMSSFGSAGVDVWKDADTVAAGIRAIEDEAAATERRLTVEQLRRKLYDRFSGDDVFIHATDLDSILDDLATADVDEEAGK